MTVLYVPEHIAVANTVQSYVHPDWTVQPPMEWETRLRQESPILDRTSHLRFRWFSAYDQWALYACTPKVCLSPERHEQLSVHWSELPTESERIVRKQHVSDYQYWMYKTHGVEACPFLILQGSFGGTPAAWTEREKRILRFKLLPEDVPPLGALEPCPFDERTVRAIRKRDRLVRADQAMMSLEALNSKEGTVAEIQAADKEFRQEFMKYLSHFSEDLMAYIKAIQARSETSHLFRGNDVADGKAAAAWEEQYVETGIAPDGGPTSII